MRTAVRVLTCASVLLLTLTALALAQLPPGWTMTVGTATSHAISSPFSELPVCPGLPILSPSATASQPFNSLSPQSSMPAPVLSFEGMALDELGPGCSSGIGADDDSAAAGPNNYVQVVNQAISVYDKQGNRLIGPLPTKSFWSGVPQCKGQYTDSVVAYDQLANRWILSRPAGKGPAYECMAVSQTPDPAGPYNQYSFEVSAIYDNDYPKVSVWPDAYYATGDPNKIFSGTGNLVSAFDRAAMIAGASNPRYVTFFVPAPPPNDSSVHSHMLAAQLDGKKLPPKGAPEYIVQLQDSHWGFPAGRLQIYEFSVDWNNPASSTLVPTDSLAPQPFNTNVCPQQACIPEPGTTNLLDSLAYGYLMQRVAYRNIQGRETMVLNHTVAADGNPAEDHAGIRWYELRKQNQQPWTIHQQGTYAPDANNRWLGSIAMDGKGNIALGFDLSSSDVYPSIHYAGRRANDPLNQLPLAEAALVDGGGSQTSTFAYGDYSEITIDPADDCTFWYTNEYYPATTSPDVWHTRIGAFRFPDCRPGQATVQRQK